MTIQILKRRFVDVGMPTEKVCAKGRYKIIKIKGGIQIAETPWFDNLILDSGLNRWGTGAIISGAAVGTGSSTPLVSQTSLDTESTFTTTAVSNEISAAGESPYNNTRTLTYRTTLGALNGSYSEVGVGWGTGTMFSRALIDPAISVASDEQLDIIYQLSVYPPLTDTTESVTISGVTHTVTGRAANVNATSGNSAWTVRTAGTMTLNNLSNFLYAGSTLGAITASPSGTVSGTASVSTDAYSNGTYTKTGTITWGLTGGNVPGGIGAIQAPWGGHGSFQYGFSPTVAKDATKTVVFNVSTTWARR